MQRSKSALVSLLTLSLLLCSTKIWASEINLHPSDYSCLSRDQKEKINVCFDENFACHEALDKVQSKPMPSWELVALGIAAGMITGMVLDAQLHR